MGASTKAGPGPSYRFKALVKDEMTGKETEEMLLVLDLSVGNRLQPKNRKDKGHPVANLAARPSATSDNVNKHPPKRPRCNLPRQPLLGEHRSFSSSRRWTHPHPPRQPMSTSSVLRHPFPVPVEL
ncbi:hypothetical protein Bbelb_252710 [Branchiostoma belcheri]|nr:hypothetical protein Bbelb_252710 [Branchiostoma belcheri]